MVLACFDRAQNKKVAGKVADSTLLNEKRKTFLSSVKARQHAILTAYTLLETFSSSQ